MKTKSIIFPLLLLILVVNSGVSQRWEDGRLGHRTMTFERPKSRPIPNGYDKVSWEVERQRIAASLEQDKLKYELRAGKKLKQIRKYFETLTRPSVYEAKKEATKRRIKKLFKDFQNDGIILYEGTYLDEDLNLKTKTTTIDKYIDYMSNYTKKENSLVNLCWSIGLDTIDFTTNRTNQKIGIINGKIPKSAKISRKTGKDNYHVYTAKGYIREDIAFFKDNQTTVKTICQEITFQLRYLEVALGVDSIGYDWVVYISAIRSGRGKACGKIKAGDCDPPARPIDSTAQPLVYNPIPIWTYLAPGTGWKYMGKQKIPYWSIITVTSIGALGTGLYYKRRSDNYYGKHLNATTFRELDLNYDTANKDNKRFIVLAGTGLAIWAISDGILFFKDRRQRKLFNERFNQPRSNLQINSFRPDINLAPNGELVYGLNLTVKF